LVATKAANALGKSSTLCYDIQMKGTSSEQHDTQDLSVLSFSLVWGQNSTACGKKTSLLPHYTPTHPSRCLIISTVKSL